MAAPPPPGYPAPPPGYPVTSGPSSGFAHPPPGAIDPRAAPPDGGKVAAGVPYDPAQQQQQQAYPGQQQQQQGYPQQYQQPQGGYPGGQQPQPYVDPNTGQTVYYHPNGQPYYANQVYPPPPNPYAQNPHMAAYPQQQQQQYPGGGGGSGGAGAGAGICAGVLGACLACLCLDAIF